MRKNRKAANAYRLRDQTLDARHFSVGPNTLLLCQLGCRSQGSFVDWLAKPRRQGKHHVRPGCERGRRQLRSREWPSATRSPRAGERTAHGRDAVPGRGRGRRESPRISPDRS